MDNNEKKALEFMREAESKGKKKGGFLTKIFGSFDDSSEVVELYEKAGNYFKMAKNWKSAGEAYVLAGNIQNTSGVKHEAATKYVDAATCFRKVSQDYAIRNLLKAVDILTEMGKFSIAAKHHMTIAEIYEEDLAKVDLAQENYRKAADYYAGEQSTSQANKCRLKVADFCMQLEQYETATEIYDDIGRKSMENKLLQYGAKDHFFKAILCMMSVDIVNAQKGLAIYEEMYPLFTDSREYKLVKKLVTAIENKDVDGYVNAIKDHESISRLEPRLIKILLSVKKSNFPEEKTKEPELGRGGGGDEDDDDAIN